ncbi:ABC transporter substrate-binding protein [Rhizobium sp. 1AS11]|uniref:ABC transporter substrate-binding protein n=1 Tax=Rhizobium acaciae TaxID=2989736 RepID=UPI0022231082|nr:ABC transporter substrate-binding protein [Rhizobium acaciae]MCW1411309.1 ABC transporter substrate-binding protein [Rhizobium acaciae]MCW1743279.1 ABC transporter substrate-binding protein [Rhizobium acaciae]
MKTDGFNVSRRDILRMGGGALALAAAGPMSQAMAAGKPATLPYTVNIVNTSSNATLVLQALLDQLGYLTDFNVKTTTTNVADGTKLMGSLISTESDICVLSGFSQVLPAIEKGAKLKVVGAANQLIAQALYSSDPSIKKVEDLKGKTVGTGALGALLHQMMVALLRKHGVNPADVQFVNIGSSAAVFKSVVAGKVAAGPAMTDVYDQQQQYGVHAVADFWSELPEYPYQGSYASQNAIDTKREGLIRVLAAYCKMYRFMMDDPNANEAFMQAYKAAVGASEEAQGRMMIKFTRDYKTYSRDLILTQKQIDYMQDLNLEFEIQKGKLAFDKVVDLSLAKEAVKLVDAG